MSGKKSSLQINFQNINTGRVVWIMNLFKASHIIFCSVYYSIIDNIINILKVIIYQNILQFIISMSTYIQKDMN